MNKGKNIFLFVFTSLLLVISISAVSLYDNVKNSYTNLFEGIEYYYEDEFQYLTIDLAMQVDDTYEPLEVMNVDSDKKNSLLNELNDSIFETRTIINSDRDFYYVAKNLKTDEVITNIKDYSENSIDPSEYGYYVDLRYDEEGVLKVDGTLAIDVFSNLNSNTFIRRYRDNEQASLGISIENPTNLEIQYMIPHNVESIDGISGFVNNWEQYSSFSGLALMTMSIIVCVFILFYPIKYVNEAYPFNKVCTWSIEVNIILWTTILSVVYVGMFLLVGNTINGNLARILVSMGLQNTEGLQLAINILCWYISSFCVGISAFLIKDIIVSRPMNYLKNHSSIIAMIRWFQNKLEMLTDIQLTEKMNKQILKYLLFHACIIIVICFFGSIDIILAILLVIIYVAYVYVHLNKRVSKVQNDYDQLLKYIQGIISENFNNEDVDLGIFNSSKDDLNQLSQNFEAAVQEKVKSQKLKTELISNVSHDLKTPLTCIKNYTTLLKDDHISNEDREHYVGQLTVYTNRLKNLIEELFEISKIDSGNINLKLQDLDIVSLLNQVYMENEEMLESKNLEVIKKYDVDRAVLRLDSDKTFRIFENLFTNIGKYALSNSRVYISIHETNESIEIEFSNISEVPMDFSSEEITERFVRGDKSRSKQGSGLGLAIARSFTEVQGGLFNITIDCDLFKVKITLPKKDSD